MANKTLSERVVEAIASSRGLANEIEGRMAGPFDVTEGFMLRAFQTQNELLSTILLVMADIRDKS